MLRDCPFICVMEKGGGKRQEEEKRGLKVVAPNEAAAAKREKGVEVTSCVGSQPSQNLSFSPMWKLPLYNHTFPSFRERVEAHYESSVLMSLRCDDPHVRLTPFAHAGLNCFG